MINWLTHTHKISLTKQIPSPKLRKNRIKGGEIEPLECETLRRQRRRDCRDATATANPRRRGGAAPAVS